MGHGHDHAAGHHDPSGHHHGHGHVHAAPRTFGKAFAIGIALNLAFVVVEVVYGIVSHSMALVADAGHNLSDVLGLALSWGASILARRAPTARRTYGFRSSTILASLTNAVVLLIVTGGIAWESLRRLAHPPTVTGATVIIVALVGVAINGSTALLFMSGRKGDLNVRSAFLHLASDAGLALGVAVAGGVMLYTGWEWVDPVVSLALSVTILASTWSLLKGSVNLILNAVPDGIDPDAVKAYLTGLPGVRELHDLHIWAMSTTENALTAHLVMASGSCHERFLGDVCNSLHEKFGIEHATLQVEPPEAPDPCRLAPEGSL